MEQFMYSIGSQGSHWMCFIVQIKVWSIPWWCGAFHSNVWLVKYREYKVIIKLVSNQITLALHIMIRTNEVWCTLSWGHPSSSASWHEQTAHRSFKKLKNCLTNYMHPRLVTAMGWLRRLKHRHGAHPMTSSLFLVLNAIRFQYEQDSSTMVSCSL